MPGFISLWQHHPQRLGDLPMMVTCNLVISPSYCTSLCSFSVLLQERRHRIVNSTTHLFLLAPRHLHLNHNHPEFNCIQSASSSMILCHHMKWCQWMLSVTILRLLLKIEQTLTFLLEAPYMSWSQRDITRHCLQTIHPRI